MPQNASHNWFGDMSENLVRYLLADAGMEVFAAGKWGADAAYRYALENLWGRIEVRSTDCKQKPRKKGATRMSGRAEMAADVTMRELGTFSVEFTKLDQRGCRQGGCKFRWPKDGGASKLRAWIIGHQLWSEKEAKNVAPIELEDDATSE
jgi:hypothetical protein